MEVWNINFDKSKHTEFPNIYSSITINKVQSILDFLYVFCSIGLKYSSTLVNIPFPWHYLLLHLLKSELFCELQQPLI